MGKRTVDGPGQAVVEISFLSESGSAYWQRVDGMIALLGFFEQAFGPGLEILSSEFGTIRISGLDLERLRAKVAGA